MSVRTLCWTPWTKLDGQHRDRGGRCAGQFLIHAHADPGGALYQHHGRPSRAASPSDRRTEQLVSPIESRVAELLTTLDRQPYTRAPTRLWNTPRELHLRHGVGVRARGALGTTWRCGPWISSPRMRPQRANSRQTRAQLRGGRVGRRENAFEAAASLLGPAEHEKYELLVRLAEAAFWLMDVPAPDARR